MSPSRKNSKLAIKRGRFLKLSVIRLGQKPTVYIWAPPCCPPWDLGGKENSYKHKDHVTCSAVSHKVLFSDLGVLRRLI